MSYVDKNKRFNAEWKIENFSLFRLAGKKILRSPVFKTNTAGVIRWWRLLVYYSDWNVEFQLVIYKGRKIYGDLLEIFLLSNGVEVQLPLSSEEPESYKKGTHTVRIENPPGIAGFPYLVKCELSIEDGRGHCLSEDSISPTTGWLFFLNLRDHYGDLTLDIKCLVATDMGYQPESTKFPTPVSNASITAVCRQGVEIVETIKPEHA
ncbi:hypothetical protein JTE90_005720 [Oedothorax gibbosus]|uniref:MATH domain-containing protein n=1 Tax=Oedothorax gibbosus TaxID=931172 RepID=A0AAV6UN19_9ARAC|nr:hypothetical protein JTE90_005720 [Oedothorax gibbosus]